MLKMILLDSMDVRYFRIIPILYVYIYISRSLGYDWNLKVGSKLTPSNVQFRIGGKIKETTPLCLPVRGVVTWRAANIKIWEMRFWEIELSNLQCISPEISIIYKHRSSFSLPFDNLTRYRFVLSRFWLRISQFIPIRFISSIFRARKCGRGINSTCKNKLHDGKKMILGIIGIKRAREKERRWKRSRAVYR